MLDEFRNFIMNNEIFSGVAGASLFGGVIYQLKNIPTKILRSISHLCFVELEVSNDSADSLYFKVILWTSDKCQRWHNKNIKLINPPNKNYSQDNLNNSEWILSPGIGNHLIFFKHRPIIFSRNVSNQERVVNKHDIHENVKLKILGFNRNIINQLIDEIKNYKNSTNYIDVYILREGYWEYYDNKRIRSIDSIILNDNVISLMVSDIQNFLDKKEWYYEKGLTHKRGYLFYGNPGTGKTSTIFALAGYFGYPIYVLNIGSLISDDNLINGISMVPANVILLIEDIDALSKFSKNRDDNNDNDNTNKLTLSSMLNMLDGMLAKDGRIIFITSNYIDRLDAALIRSGRIDKQIEFKFFDKFQIMKMLNLFFEDVLHIDIPDNISICPADLHAICMENSDIDIVREKIMEKALFEKIFDIAMD